MSSRSEGNHRDRQSSGEHRRPPSSREHRRPPSSRERRRRSSSRERRRRSDSRERRPRLSVRNLPSNPFGLPESPTPSTPLWEPPVSRAQPSPQDTDRVPRPRERPRRRSRFGPPLSGLLLPGAAQPAQIPSSTQPQSASAPILMAGTPQAQASLQTSRATDVRNLGWPPMVTQPSSAPTGGASLQMPASAWQGLLDTSAQPPSALPRVQPAPIGGRPAEYQTTDWSVLHPREPTLMSEAARQQVASAYPFQVSTDMPGLFRDSPVVAGTHVAVPTVHANLGLTGVAGAPMGATQQVGGPGMGAYVPWYPRPATPLGQAKGLPEGGTHYLGASSAGQQPRGVRYSSTFRGEPVHKLMTQIRTHLGMRLDDGVPVFGGTAPG